MNSNTSLKSLCCPRAATLVGKGSPFGKIIAMEFYDGPVSGVVRCTSCGSVLQFKWLAWDERQEKRVFALARMPGEAWDEIIALYAHDQPRFPVWVPKWVDLPKDELDKRENALQTVLARRGEWAWIVLMSRYLDLLIDFREAAELVPHIEAQAIYGEPKWRWLELFGPA
jgi:hypothetical protein